MKSNTKLTTYSDGDELENAILERVTKHTEGTSLDEFISNSSWPWAMKYHLHPDRQNILSWFDFGKSSSVLEIGGGCGAITPLLCRSAGKVDVVELSKRRSQIIESRCREFDNVSVFAENLQSFDVKHKYNFITSIGVLEYSRSFIETKNPFLDFLKKAYDLLDTRGCMIIAIENKFGIKYWSGAPEDHTNRHFDSIEGYPGIEMVKTFSRLELADLLDLAGFRKVEFYYPYPDYKFAYEIFSDQMLPNSNFDINPGLFPSFHPSPREHIFNEYLATKELTREGLFGEFANSFLIFAYKS